MHRQDTVSPSPQTTDLLTRRLARGVSLRELSAETGIAFSYLSAIERGIKPLDRVTLGHVRRLAAFYGLTLDELAAHAPEEMQR